MKKKRIPALLTAAACTAVMLSSMPISPVSASTAVRNDFEVTYEGWHGTTTDVTLTALDGIGYDGSRGMLVTDRTKPEDGAQAEKYFYLEGGIKYNYSVRVFAETEETFSLTVTTVDANGKETVKVLDTKKVSAGKWATLSGSYRAPANDGEFRIVVNTESENDFRIDDVEITSEAGITLNAKAADLGIKDMLVNYGIRSGNIHNYSTINDNGIKARYLKDHNAIECENETKPDATLVQSGSSNTNIKVSLNSCSAIADWCQKNNLGFRGHTMVWHSQTPQWFFKDNFQNGGNWVSSSTMDQRLESYIKNMFSAFATQYPTLNLYAYDICNECISDDASRTSGTANGARVPGYGNGASPWVQVYGSNAFIEKAFTYADKYKPANCHLFYNDYNEYWDHKRDCIIKTCKPLLEKGVLQGIGMQSHVDAQANTFSGTTNYLKAMDMYLNNGFEVQVTELDVSLKDGGNASTQAEKYKAIVSHAMEWNEAHPNGPRVTLFQVWGADDNHTWLGSGTNPLLYDGSGNAKSAYSAITSIIPQSQWGDGTKFGDDVVIQEPELDADGYWFHYTFESGTEGFSGRAGGETLTSTGDQAYEGSKSMYVSGRTAAWHGAAVSLNSRIFKAGEAFSFSGCVYIDSSASAETMHFTIQYKDADGETQYLKIATLEDAPTGQWIQLKNTEFTIPSGASSVVAYFECDGETTSFYVDEVIGAPKGTVIPGPGGGVKIVRGDVTGDGKVNGSDLSAMKRGLLSGTYASAQAKKNADVDKSGSVDAEDAKLMVQFLLGEISEFPTAVAKVDFTEMAKAFMNVKAGTSLKKDNENNPMTTQRFGADPGWMVYKDRLYIYTTNDAWENYSGGGYQINTYNSGTINCVSSADLVNWTDHGAIPVADRNGRTTNGAAKWASAAWAPDACWKTMPDGKDKFFLYFADSANGIGVLTADSPEGPWSDPLGQALVGRSSSYAQGVEWLFDPGVYYDPETNEAYLAFGGGVPSGKAANPGTGRIAKLNSDMTSIAQVKNMSSPYLFEDSSLIKINGKWYYSYCANWNVPGGTNINGVSFGNADILYMVNSNPMGDWGSSQLTGNCFKNTATQNIDRGGNNHHSIIFFKDKYYIAYHSRQYSLRTGMSFTNKDNPSEKSADGNYRSTQINEATLDSSGKITCSGNMTGCKQIEYLNPYVTNRAATMANQYGIQISGVGNTKVTDIQAGDWVKVKGVNFSDGCHELTVKASSSQGAVIKVTTGGPDGEAFAYVQVPAGSSQEITVATANIDGVNDITFEFSGQMEFETWQFS